MNNKNELYYIVLPASEGKYKFGSIKRDTKNSLIPPSFAALFEKNPLLVLQTVNDGSKLYVTDIFGGLEDLTSINPLNEELFCKWVNRFDYLCTIMGALGLQAHLPYVVSDNNPMFCKLKQDESVTLIKIAKNS